MKHPLLLIATALLLSARAAQAAPASVSHGIDGCGSQEFWEFDASLSPEFTEKFNALLSRKTPPVQSFGQALAMRQFAKGPTSRLFGEYWISRALYDASLLHIAHGGLSAVATQAPSKETVGIQLTAVDCLLKIHNRYPSFNLPPRLADRLPEYRSATTQPKDLERIWNAADAVLRTFLASDSASKKDYDKLLGVLQGAGPHESFAQALVAIRNGNPGAGVQHLNAFLGAPLPAHLRRYEDEAHILLARSLFLLGNYEGSANEWKKVTKKSNELVQSLSELSWGQLMDGRYGDAIGTATNLQAGGLRGTFAPEAPMVMAMAMNELCQFPESVRAIRMFQKNYETAYRWLSGWAAKPTPLYPLAIQQIRKTSKVPDRVGTEWIRSKIFISHQEEINLLFDEREHTKALAKSGADLQFKLVQNTLAFARDLKPRLKLAKMKLRAGELLPGNILADLDSLRHQIVELRRLQRAAPVWRTILANYNHQVPTLEGKLIASINKDLDGRTLRMYLTLEEIAENLQLLEVEIYNGATHDIIWQNSHPDYKKTIAQLQDDDRPSQAKTWNWGRAPAGLEETMEIWEDELGSFQASVFDNCSSKDRYLALQMKKRAR